MTYEVGSYGMHIQPKFKFSATSGFIRTVNMFRRLTDVVAMTTNNSKLTLSIKSAMKQQKIC